MSGNSLRDNDEATGERVQNTRVIPAATQDYGTETVLFLRIASFFQKIIVLP